MLKIWGKMNKEMERVTYEESIRERISLSKEGWKTSFRNALTKIFSSKFATSSPPLNSKRRNVIKLEFYHLLFK